MNTDPLIVGDRLWGASTRLMAALHVERIAETEMEKAMPDMVPVFETAIEAAHAQTTTAWRECVDALGDWAGLRMGLDRFASPSLTPKEQTCEVPPPGWYCTRAKGHEGPCAAWPKETP